MIPRSYVCVLLAALIVLTNVADSEARPDIFKPPDESDISDIEGNSTPWVIDEFIPKIQEFKDNVFEELKKSPQVQKIYGMESDSKTTRDIYFRIVNKFLAGLKHPVPSALANIISKSASLFEPLTMPIFFETVAVSLAEFLLNHNVEVDASSAKRYVDLLSDALDKADMDDLDAIWQATLDAYADFAKSYDFELIDIIDELLELFASELIVLHDK